MCVKYELAQDMVVGNDWMLRGRAREARIGEAFLSSSPNVGSCVRFIENLGTPISCIPGLARRSKARTALKSDSAALRGIIRAFRKIVLRGWDLRNCVVYVEIPCWRVGPGGRPWLHLPQAQMLEYLLYELPILDKRNHTHPSLALGTAKRVRLVDFLNQASAQHVISHISGNSKEEQRVHPL